MVTQQEVAIVTGIIGAITGISGAIMGYLAYRRTTRIKSLDLRLELRKAENTLNDTISKLEGLLPRANGSRRAVESASGMRSSGAADIWQRDFEADTTKVAVLVAQRPAADHGGYQGLSPEQLEERLVVIHRTQGGANSLVSKYEGSLAADNEARRAIAETNRAMQGRTS
jgi:hypothetical protein